MLPDTVCSLSVWLLQSDAGVSVCLIIWCSTTADHTYQPPGDTVWALQHPQGQYLSYTFPSVSGSIRWLHQCFIFDMLCNKPPPLPPPPKKKFQNFPFWNEKVLVNRLWKIWKWGIWCFNFSPFATVSLSLKYCIVPYRGTLSNRCTPTLSLSLKYCLVPCRSTLSKRCTPTVSLSLKCVQILIHLLWMLTFSGWNAWRTCAKQ